jgi:hypothetical protein
MVDHYLLEWSYVPNDFFEEPISIQRDGIDINLENGIINAKIRPDLFISNNETRNQFHSMLNDYFLTIEFLFHKAYLLSEPTLTRVFPDGRKEYHLFVASSTQKVTGSNIDIIYADRNGKVISDTRQERLTRNERYIDLVQKYRSKDITLSSILSSYHLSVTDPENELIHLYEIRDALCTQFNGEDNAINALVKSPRAQWKKLGILANTEPLNQGRHRGKYSGKLRNANPQELEEARSISRNLIIAYLEYLNITIV